MIIIKQLPHGPAVNGSSDNLIRLSGQSIKFFQYAVASLFFALAARETDVQIFFGGIITIILYFGTALRQIGNRPPFGFAIKTFAKILAYDYRQPQTAGNHLGRMPGTNKRT